MVVTIIYSHYLVIAREIGKSPDLKKLAEVKDGLTGRKSGSVP